jgi:hypothetical protein
VVVGLIEIRGIFSVLTTLCGFAITKADMFPAVASRGAGQILIVSQISQSELVHAAKDCHRTSHFHRSFSQKS